VSSRQTARTSDAAGIPTPDEIHSLSRELALVCDPAGRVVWADDRARRIIGAAAGLALSDLCVPGTANKALELAKRASKDEVTDWEIAAISGGEATPLTFHGKPYGNGLALLVAQLAPRQFHAAIEGMQSAMADIVGLNRQIARQKHEIQQQAGELREANQNLTESNRGILSLHRELEDRALTLSHTADVKARVISSVSHEFRTPLTSILGLTQLLIDGSDGPLNSEQIKQVRFIRSSAEELIAMVNDILDLSKIESGTATLRISSFSAHEFLTTLRGALRPLAREGGVALTFALEGDDFTFETDRSKLAQIMRNFVSNALKFTEHGEVQVHVRATDDGRALLSVTDSGIGIPAKDVDRIFEEFAQVEHPLQSRVKGTGLGLPIAKRLADILGGEISVESVVDDGSTFTLVIPVVHPDAVEMNRVERASEQRDPSRASVLVVEDDRRTLFVYERYLSNAGFQVIPARTVDAARQALEKELPVAIVLDVVLEEENTWAFLADVKRDPRTRNVPVLVVTVSNKGDRARALGADEFWLKPIDQERLLKRLRSLTRTSTHAVRVLVVDDDEKARYLMRRHMEALPHEFIEAATGDAGIRLARSERPHVIFLDFLLESMTAFDVLDELKSDPNTRDIPVIVVTSHMLDAAARDRLSRDTEGVIAKQNLSRELAINRIRDALRKSGVQANL